MTCTINPPTSLRPFGYSFPTKQDIVDSLDGDEANHNRHKRCENCQGHDRQKTGDQTIQERVSFWRPEPEDTNIVADGKSFQAPSREGQTRPNIPL